MFFDKIIGCFVVKDIINEQIGLIYVEVGDEIIVEYDCDGEILGGLLKVLLDNGIEDILVLDIDYVNVGFYICNIMVVDKNMNCEGVFMDIYCVMCLGELLIVEVVLVLFGSLFFDSECYDLFVVGWVKMNMCLNFDVLDIQCMLCYVDIIVCICGLVELCDGKGEIDDIDYFGNCCVCLVGELMENQYCIGLLCMECVICECMFGVEIDIVMLQDLINVKFVVVVVCEFFGLLQLLQFMDQINLLLEVMYKCCLLVLGLGGLICECVGFEVCDVYLIYYGWMCLIEMLEGQNIGLINLLVIFVCVNKYGFIEIFYCKVIEGVVMDDVVYLLVIEEMCYIIVQVNVMLDEGGKFVDELILICQVGDFMLNLVDVVDLIDVLLKQLVLVVVVLILFFENDDVNCVLMGVNM